MGHGHAHHHHHHTPGDSLKPLALAILLTLGYGLIELIVGLHANSLALIGDAGHMASDAAALAIALMASWIAKRGPSHHHTYGLGRAEVIAALLSSLIMIGLCIAIIIEAILRLHIPPAVHGLSVMVVASLGMGVNLLIAYLLSTGQQTINMRAAMLHVLGDILGSFAALLSGAILYYTHWRLADPVLSIFISLLIGYSAINLLKEGIKIIMEGTPSHLDINHIADQLSAIEGVIEVNDLHIWSLSSDRIALSAHVQIVDLIRWSDILHKISTFLATEYSIKHITLQPEITSEACHHCEPHQ